MAALNFDIRNLLTHNRGITNRYFKQRHPEYPAQVGEPIVFNNERDVGNIIGTMAYHARQLDLRAIEKFKLNTVEPFFKEEAASQ